MSQLRLLLPGPAEVGDLEGNRSEALQALADLYAYPSPVPPTGWVRASMVATVDGSAAGPDGRSESISSPADRAVFTVLRALADVVLVGAGTARAERYRLPVPNPEFTDRRRDAGQAAAPVLALVTVSGSVPDPQSLFAPGAPTLLVTCAGADVASLRARFGAGRVVVAGERDVDPALAVAQLAGRGLTRVLLEGGPTLLGAAMADGRLDELCLTTTPTLAAGQGPRIAHGLPAGRRLRLGHLVEADGSLLTRWVAVPTGRT